MDEQGQPPDDPKGKRVKAAMGRKRPVGGFAVIEGGKDAAPRPKRTRRAKDPAAPGPQADDPSLSQDGVPDGSGPDVPPQDDDELPPVGIEEDDIRRAGECALLDQNDRDNGRRLIAWFGLDLAYVPGMGWMVFSGTHWLRDEGELAARLKAQNLVDKIKLEAVVLDGTPAQLRLLEAAASAEKKRPGEVTEADQKLLTRAAKVREMISKSARSGGNSP